MSGFTSSEKDLEAGCELPLEKGLRFPSKGRDLYKKVTQYNSFIFPVTLASTFYRESPISSPNLGPSCTVWIHTIPYRDSALADPLPTYMYSALETGPSNGPLRCHRKTQRPMELVHSLPGNTNHPHAPHPGRSICHCIRPDPAHAA